MRGKGKRESRVAPWLLASLVAVALALAAGPGMALGPETALAAGDSSVTVEGVRAGDRVNVYRIVESDERGNYVFVDDCGLDMAEFQDAASDSEQLRGFVERIAAAVHGSGREPSATAVSGGADVAFSGLERGQYLVSVVPASPGCGVVYQNTTVNAGDAVRPKSQPITLAKTVGGANEADAYSVGQRVPFALSTFVPSYPADAAYRTLRIEDVSSAGLSFGADDIVARCGDTVLERGVHYAYSARAAEGGATRHVLDFAYPAMEGFGGQALSVEIAALVTDAAVPATPEANEATVFFRNNPYVDGDEDSASDAARVRVYGIRLLKVARGTGQVLQGARFEVLAADGAGDSTIELDGVPVRVRTAGSMTTDAQGIGSVAGLGAGTYYLRETAAPTGYTLVEGILEVPVAADAVLPSGAGEWAGYVDAGTIENPAVEPDTPGSADPTDPPGAGAPGAGLVQTGDIIQAGLLAAIAAAAVAACIVALRKRREP